MCVCVNMEWGFFKYLSVMKPFSYLRNTIKSFC